MKDTWGDRKNILCIRLDNMGDLLMSSPAIRALKETFDCKITVLTSTAAAAIAKHIPCIDEVLSADVPWVKNTQNEGAAGYLRLVSTLREFRFDAAVVFTVFSQNPLPSVMLAYLAGIPYRLAYCRENPYDLLTHWAPDHEPYSMVLHQVERDIELVKTVGARIAKHNLVLNVPNDAYAGMSRKITQAGINTSRPWIVVHPGASEPKRLYPSDRFRELLKKILANDVQIALTGTAGEKELIQDLLRGLGDNAVSIAAQLSLPEFMAAIDVAPAVLSVNTGTVHIAAALNTPVVVLYAATNPQHTPWNASNEVFLFPVPDKMQSKNEVIGYVREKVMQKCEHYPDPAEVTRAVMALMRTAHQPQA